MHTFLESEEQQLFLEQDFTTNLVDSQSYQFKKIILYIHAFLESEAQNNFCGSLTYLNSNFGIYSDILSDK